MKRTLIAILALAAGAAGQAARAETLQVSAVRCWPLSEATRVVIEVSGEFEYHAERAHNPERVFFDIFHSRPHINGRRAYANDIDGKLLKRVRVAETLPGITRVVLDLAGGADYTAAPLSNPDRLVIELRPAVSAPEPPPAGQPLPAAPVPVTAASRPEAAARQTPPVVLPPPPALESSPSRIPKLDALARMTPMAIGVPKPASVSPLPAPPRESGRAAKLATSGGANSLTRALGLKIRRVVLDPGHGGHDQGTVGPAGLMEKDLVLDVALRLGKLIEARMGSEVIFTRSDDTFVPLEGRTALANEKKADLFLSIHANSSSYPRIGGVESYYLNFTDSKASLAVAARENAASDKSVFELHDLIQRITLHDKAEESKEFASRVQTSLFAFAARYDSGIKNRGVKKAPFVVLIGASMPSVLAEVGFLSNPREEVLLKSPEHRQRLAEALYRGVYRYAQSLSHFQMALASDRLKN